MVGRRVALLFNILVNPLWAVVPLDSTITLPRGFVKVQCVQFSYNYRSSSIPINCILRICWRSRAYDDAQILDLIKRTQNLENQKNMMLGIIVFITGVVIAMFGKNMGGSSVKDIISGLMLGIGFAEMLVGIFVTASSFPKIK